jgi:hypothetical protein
MRHRLHPYKKLATGLNPKTETPRAATLHGKETREWRKSQLTRNRRKVRRKRDPSEKLVDVYRLVNAL